MSTLFRSLSGTAVRLGFGLGWVMMANGLHAADVAVPNAPMVAPAPVVDKPLAPAANDAPGEQPSPQHAWVPGHWRWYEGAYVWESGRWELPPTQGLYWHAPQWQQQANGYVLRDGFWDETPPATARPVAAPVTSAPPQEVVVAVPPPPQQREIIYERPSPLHVWIGGYWSWHLGRHVWVSGRWSTPPRQNVIWVGPRWEQRGNQYVYVEGYWREAVYVTPSSPGPQIVVSAPAPQQVVVMAPPPARQEIVYARPGPGYVWINGYWAWRGGRHVWIAGHYEMPPRGHRSWVEPRWERRGGSYIFIEGRWGS